MTDGRQWFQPFTASEAELGPTRHAEGHVRSQVGRQRFQLSLALPQAPETVQGHKSCSTVTRAPGQTRANGDALAQVHARAKLTET